ncbi:MAG TPA: acylphosphatase [Planctomycetota bacterium]|nr:acylphosphatase [Planctomycetota bacterium]
MRRVRFVVVGRVQGVGFRACTQAAAREFGLVGFVQNRADGAVEGQAEGDERAVAGFVEWLHQGSPYSRVDRVDVEDLAVVAAEVAFDVRRRG